MSEISEEKKRQITAGFNDVAKSYNHSVLRFFPFCADRIVGILKPDANDKILDVATGTGVVAIACAQAAQGGGRVIGIDLSEGMLEQSDLTAKKLDLNNIDLVAMDGEFLDFKNNYFDAVTCSFGLFFMPDMLAALKEWRRVTKPGGQLLFTSFAETAFQPMVGEFIDDLKEYGAEFDQNALSSHRLNKVEVCQQLLDDADLLESTVTHIQVGYHLQDAEDWWAVVTNSAMRNLLNKISKEKRAEFKRCHLQKVSHMVTDKGLWLDVPVLVCQGRV